MADDYEHYERTTPVRLTIQGNAGGFDVALEANVLSDDASEIDATLDKMRRAYMRQEAYMRLTLHLEDLRKAEFTLKHLPGTRELLQEQRAHERAEMVAGFVEHWNEHNRYGDFKANASQRANIEAFDKETQRRLDEIASQEKGLPIKIKQLEDVVRDYRDVIDGKDKYQAIERRFVEDNLRPHELPEAAE